MIGHAPMAKKTRPVAKPVSPIVAISSAKPRGESERCGVITAEKIMCSGPAAGASSLSGAMGSEYRASMKSPHPSPRRKAAPAAGQKRAIPATLLSPDEIERLFATLQAANPEPESELSYRNPFTLLVAVVLSAQATDAGVNKATAKLFDVADTPEKMVALGEDEVRDHIKTIGLFRNKAKNTVALSQALVERFGGEVPRDREALESLPGVGRKTANVVLNVAFGEPTMAVDTHIFRVANRTGLAPGKDPLEVEKGLMAVVPEPYRLHAHHWLILHGRYVCKARRPECGRCPIAAVCRYPDKTV